MTAIARKVGHVVWDRVVAGVVVANSAVVLAGLLGTGLDERVLGLVEDACLAFFCIELLFRFWAAGWRPDGWMLFDTALIVVGAMSPWGGGGVLALRVARVARMARLLHLVKHCAVHLRQFDALMRCRSALAAVITAASSRECAERSDGVGAVAFPSSSQVTAT